MKEYFQLKAKSVIILMSCFLLVCCGCDQIITDQLASTTGEYLGSVVSVVVTDYMQSAFGLDVEAATHEHSDSHAAGPLHNYEH